MYVTLGGTFQLCHVQLVPFHQVKLMRSKDRVNSEGIGRSQGYGFVEFMSHEAALGALSYTNNNSNLFPSGKRLVVEFAMEDSRVVKVREQRKLKQEVRGIQLAEVRGIQ